MTRRQNDKINTTVILISIVVIFVLCHLPRITIDVYEFSVMETFINCSGILTPAYPIQILAPISDFLVFLNSSCNFFVYTLVGNKFRKEFCKVFGIKVM